MTDYKKTLNLPQTDFPMKANLAQREPEQLAFWNDINLYQTVQTENKSLPAFILHDGPPYANGNIHLGTTLNKIIKDMIVKSKWLSGYRAPYVPGWDCHGLPIEQKVEKKVGKVGAKIEAKAFRQACREFAQKQVALQKADFQRLGVQADWDNPYLTMNYAYEANIVRSLATIVERGHLLRGQKPVHWCTSCASALAEAEVEYRDKASPAIDVAFPVIDNTAIAKAFLSDSSETPTWVPIWTTTPWTLPANYAISVHPELNYTWVEVQLPEQPTLRLVIAEELLDTTLARYGANNPDSYQIIGSAPGSALAGILLQHPFLDRHVPIVTGDHVTTEAGTGNVHTAPAHGLDDYRMGLEHNLPADSPVDSRSCFVDDTPLVGGLHVFKANQPIIDALQARAYLLHHESIQHSYPHCWRHKTPVIFRATPQWFISMEQQGLRSAALAAINNAQWLPSWGQERMRGMIDTRPDWCISRQRTWGVPITLFVHRQTGELHPNTTALMQQAADLIEQSGVDAWFDLEPATLIGDDAKDYDKVTDVLDVWFDAGVSHACVLDQRDNLQRPADLYFEGSDQHRGWFQTSLLTSIAMHDQAPFKAVLTHGYVLDKNGEKMSKSLGNVMSPAEVVKTLGADILRLWAAACDHTAEINVSDEILKRNADAYRRIRNTARFLLSNLHDFNPNQDIIEATQLLSLDRFMIEKTERLQAKIIQAYSQYQFQVIYQEILNFCTVDLGSFYLDIIKDRLYTSKQDGLPRRSAQTAMWVILEALARWLAPVLSFTAEEIWRHMPASLVSQDVDRDAGNTREPSVFLSQWFTAFPVFKNSAIFADADWSTIVRVRDEVNKVLESHRKAGEIGSALEADVTVYAEAPWYATLDALSDELRFILITSEAEALPADRRDGKAQDTGLSGLYVKVVASTHDKCERCWQRLDDVGATAEHPTLCGRCVSNITGDGEEREHA